MFTLDEQQYVTVMEPGANPALFVRSGDEVQARVLDWCFGLVDSDPNSWERSAQIPRCPAAGPIAVLGAQPGDCLVVDILAIEPHSPGHMVLRPGCGPLGHRITQMEIVPIPLENNMAILPSGVRVPLTPMLGVIGTAPARDSIPTLLSADHGGNLDTREVAPGSTILLPVLVEDALLSFGDAHAAMGDGELSGSGIEIAVTVRLRIGLRRGHSIPRPRIITEQSLITLATHLDVNEAIKLAADDMADWLMELTACSFREGALLIGAAASLRFSHVINKSGPTIKLCLDRSLLSVDTTQNEKNENSIET